MEAGGAKVNRGDEDVNKNGKEEVSPTRRPLHETEDIQCKKIVF